MTISDARIDKGQVRDLHAVAAIVQRQNTDMTVTKVGEFLAITAFTGNSHVGFCTTFAIPGFGEIILFTDTSDIPSLDEVCEKLREKAISDSSVYPALAAISLTRSMTPEQMAGVSMPEPGLDAAKVGELLTRLMTSGYMEDSSFDSDIEPEDRVASIDAGIMHDTALALDAMGIPLGEGQGFSRFCDLWPKQGSFKEGQTVFDVLGGRGEGKVIETFDGGLVVRFNEMEDEVSPNEFKLVEAQHSPAPGVMKSKAPAL